MTLLSRNVVVAVVFIVFINYKCASEPSGMNNMKKIPNNEIIIFKAFTGLLTLLLCYQICHI